MAIDQKHQDYLKHKFAWRSVRDAIAGSNAVKRASDIYLPIPAGFLELKNPPSITAHNSTRIGDDFNIYDVPWYHHNKPYMAYLQRARFPEITLHTLRGLVGIATRKKIELELPPALDYLETKATKDGKSLEDFFAYCLKEVLITGRLPIVVDIDAETNQVIFIPYQSENFINWNTQQGTGKTELAIFCEKKTEIDKATLESEETMSYLVYSWQDGELFVKSYDENNTLTSTVTPNLQGNKFDENPIVTIGSIENKNIPNPAPLLGISEIAYSIYRKDADLSHSEYMTCNPMFTISGAESSQPIGTNFGSQVALLLENPDAKAYFPQNDTSALSHIDKRIENLFNEAARYGATLIGPDKKSVDSFDTTKARMSAQGATLIGVVDNVVAGINKALSIAAKIQNVDENKVNLTVSTDFAERNLTPQMLTALVSSWLNGALSRETLHENMKAAGILGRNESIEEEKSRLENEGPLTDPEGDNDTT